MQHAQTAITPCAPALTTLSKTTPSSCKRKLSSPTASNNASKRVKTEIVDAPSATAESPFSTEIQACLPRPFHVPATLLTLVTDSDLHKSPLWTSVSDATYCGASVIAKQITAPTDAKVREVNRVARMCMSLHHPNIVPFYGVSSDATSVYVWLEYQCL